jgi:hypothetical protein
VPDLRVLVALGVAPPLVEAQFPADHFHDTWTPRLGAELRRRVGERVRLAARAGYAYAPTPIPEQVGLTSFADPPRHLVSVGGGVEVAGLGRVLARPWSVDVALQWHELEGHATRKDAAFSPGAGFTSGGRIVHLSAMLTGRF